MATLKYLIQSNKDNANIYIRLSIGRNNTIKRKTSLTINPKKWSKKTGFPIAKDENLKKIKSLLQKLKIHIEDNYNNTMSRGAEINSIWLENTIAGFFNQTKSTNDLNNTFNVIDYLITTASTRKNAKGGIGLSEGRIKAYRNLKNILEKHLNGKVLLIKNIDIQFVTKFKDWLINDQNYSEFYTLKKITDLKLVCKTADTLDIMVNKKILSLKIGQTKIKHIIYLNTEELQQIKQCEFEKKALINSKKWLLLGCEIGQRVDDLLNLTEDNISCFKDNKNIRIITLIQGKTNKKVIIPLNTIAEDVIKNGFPYKISSPKFNKYIKEVCKISGIDNIIPGGKMIDRRKVSGKYPKYELITSHTCRRSFATNYYGKMHTSILKTLTGHSTEKMLLTYIGKTSEDYTEQAYKAMLQANNNQQH